jgi:AN1-type zinc finger protein 1
MEFSNIGKHCFCQDCNIMDFLPFKCNLCEHSFCLGHRTYEAHKCEKYKSTIVTDEEKIKIDKVRKRRLRKIPKCIKCKMRNNMNFKCKKCNEYTCISHRMENSHNCSKNVLKVKTKNANKLQQLSNKSSLNNKVNKMSKIFGSKTYKQEARKSQFKKKDTCVVF